MTIVESVGWVLVHFVWQGAAIALGLAALLALTSAAQATLRYVLSCTALLMMLAATLTTAANLSIESPPGHIAPAAAGALVTSLPADGEDRAPADQTRPTKGTRETTADSSASWRDRLAGHLGPIVERSARWLVLIWIVGVSVMSIRLAGGWWRTHALGVDGVSAAPAWAEEMLAMLCARMRITRAVALVVSDRLSVPVLLGHAKPVVVVPAAAFAGLSPSHLEAILAHELAHVRRHDYLVNLAQSVIETLLFYHPAVWWVSHQVRVAREHCCDDLAVRACGDRRAYIHALLGLEELRAKTAMLALGAADGSLLGRARRLLRPSAPRSDAPRLAASAIVLSVVCAVAVTPFVTLDRVDASFAAAPLTVGDAVASVSAAREAVQSGKPTPVVASPDPGATLGSRWAWAERAAREARRSRYWIGYSIAPVQGLPRFVYFDRTSRVLGNEITFSGRTLSTDITGLRFPGRPLALSGGDTGLKVLFAFDAGGGTPRLTALHISTLTLPVDLKNRPVFWLGAAEASQSLELVDTLYAAAGATDLKDDLVAVVGVHDASPAVVAWLSARVDGGDPDDVRANAAEWIAWHPIRESVAVLDRIARGDRASKVRQEAAEALGDLTLPDAAPVLVALARELQDEAARGEAVEALGARSESIAHEALVALARHDTSPEIQREAVETLGEIDDPKALEHLRELAQTHPDRRVRAEAVETLGDTKSPAASVSLLKGIALGDLSTSVQHEAIETLRDLPDGAGLGALVELAREHPDDGMRKQALEALRESDHPKARELFDRSVGRSPRR